MRIGQIPEYSIDMTDGMEGLPMVKINHDGRSIWVELHDPLLDGLTLTRDQHGALIGIRKENT